MKLNKITSNKLNREAPRPFFSVLDNFMLRLYKIDNFKNWEISLKDYLK